MTRFTYCARNEASPNKQDSYWSLGVEVPGMGEITLMMYDDGTRFFWDAPPGQGGEPINFNEEDEVVAAAERAVIYYQLTGTIEGFVADADP